jgi:Flp pilus assembly pilin Flp
MTDMLELLMLHVRGAVRREEGQALVEYALILTLVSVVAVAVLTALGANIVPRIQEAVDALA